MELASQECCLHRILFTCRYVTFVLVIITFAFTLYSVVGSFHVKSPNALNGSDPDFDENAYIWSM